MRTGKPITDYRLQSTKFYINDVGDQLGSNMRMYLIEIGIRDNAFNLALDYIRIVSNIFKKQLL